MKHIRIGDLTLSTRVLGTDYFGSGVSEEDAFRLMDLYFAAGGNTLDTARMYANWLPGGDGASERTIGRWLAASGMRARTVLITKGGHGVKGGDPRGRLHAAELRQDMEESLENLRCTPDLYLLHRDNPDVGVAEIMETLGEFVRKGYTKQIGCSNWRGVRIREANAYAAAHGLPPFAASEIQWSLALSDCEMQGDASLVCMDKTEFAFYEETGMSVLAFSSQAKGYFARFSSLETQNGKAMGRFDCPENRERAERAAALARRLGVGITAAALAYIDSNRFPACALVGCKRPEQIEDSMKDADLALSAEDLAFLEGEARFPGRFGA